MSRAPGGRRANQPRRGPWREGGCTFETRYLLSPFWFDGVVYTDGKMPPLAVSSSHSRAGLTKCLSCLNFVTNGTFVFGVPRRKSSSHALDDGLGRRKIARFIGSNFFWQFRLDHACGGWERSELQNPNKILFLLTPARSTRTVPRNQRTGFVRGRRILSSVSDPDCCFP